MRGFGGLNKSPNVVVGLVPWENEGVVTDGTSCGFPPPSGTYQGGAK
jgi:hypothetical protein